MINEEATRLVFAIFNDPEFFEPMFERGELHAGLRGTLLDSPLYEDSSLWSVIRKMKFHNEERAASGKLHTYGPVLIVVRTETVSKWRGVTQVEIAEASR